MNIEDGQGKIIYLLNKYIDDAKMIDGFVSDMMHPPPRVPVRALAELLAEHSATKIDKDDKELLDDLFYYFG